MCSLLAGKPGEPAAQGFGDGWMSFGVAANVGLAYDSAFPGTSVPVRLALLVKIVVHHDAFGAKAQCRSRQR
jgi:hypothetical protein